MSLLANYTIVEKEGSSEAIYDKDKLHLIKYPNYGTIYAKMTIPSIDVKVNVYYGDSLEILKYGAGHSSQTYFPGEGGTILVAAHNAKYYFGLIPELIIGDKIIYDTNYGKFTYEVTKTEIKEASILEQMEIQHDYEELVMYTCYPVNRPGLKTKRFVVYSKLVGVEYES